MGPEAGSWGRRRRSGDLSRGGVGGSFCFPCDDRAVDLPHPVTGDLFPSPVAPGTGWPDDPARPDTPTARTAEDERRFSASCDLPGLDAAVSVCRACERLVEWRERVATGKRAAYATEPYWGRPIAGWGSSSPRVLVVGL